jgi:hypothetical protein
MACATSHAVPKSDISHRVMSHGITPMTLPGATAKNAAERMAPVDVRGGRWMTLHASSAPLSRQPSSSVRVSRLKQFSNHQNRVTPPHTARCNYRAKPKLKNRAGSRGPPEDGKHARTRRFGNGMHNGVAGPRLPASMMENVMLCILMTPEELKVLVRSCELMQKYKLHAENRMFVSLLDRVALVA